MNVTMQDRVAIVTGGSKGLGFAMARRFAESGGKVAIVARGAEDLAAARTALAKDGLEVRDYVCDVSKAADISSTFEKIVGDFGKVDILVNNAGMSPLYDSVADVDSRLFDKVISVNLRAPFRLAALIGTRMKAGDGGSIINISSVEAARPHPEALPYAAAKAGLNALTVGFAKAFAPTVRVNTIQAGGFLTDISQSWTAEMRADMSKGTMLGRAGEPTEITGAALYLASAASAYCTGSILQVDGGLL
jgi:NAD(P)-dependent dehydrogenase (short-subunit alcohol dehydrogenase family)